MKSMFGISPERAAYPNDGCSTSLLAGLGISWLCHLIGLHPMLMYYTRSGLSLHEWQLSPERAAYTNDGCSTSLIQGLGFRGFATS